MSLTSIETFTGKMFDLASPTPDMVCMEDIAWSLARIPRYNGHTLSAETYSVAQHSVFVMRLLQERGADLLGLLYGLMHDAHEAYTGDFSKPMKMLLDFRHPIERLEQRTHLVVMRWVEQDIGTPVVRLITGYIRDESKIADNQALEIEAFNLMRSRGRGWAEFNHPEHERASEEKLMSSLHVLPPELAARAFETAYQTLKKKIRQEYA
jgi:hypothetical protein